MDDSKKTTLRIIAIFDGRPGHEKQTLGIIDALKKFVPVDITLVHVERASVLKSICQTIRLFLPVSGASHPDLAQTDLLIGTGTQTHLPLLLLKKRRSIPVCTCMNPAVYLRKRFDLCFVPAHDGTGEVDNNIFNTFGAPNNCTNIGQHKEDCGLILLGGEDPKSHKWENTAIVRQVQGITESADDKRWTISSSPRTPSVTIEKIKELSAAQSHVTFFDYRDTKPGWIEAQYNKNAEVWVTSDSISMVYEALTAGCKVGIIPMQWRSQNSKFKRNEDVLLKEKLVISYTSLGQTNATWDKSTELNEAQRCAEQIIKRWWPKNLQ